MKKAFSIRLATTWDIEKIMSIAKKSKELNLVGFLTESDIDYCINVAKMAKFYVATEYSHNKVIGFIYGFVEVPSTACLMYICVKDNWQKIGIGRALVAQFVSDMKAFGVDKIYCLTTTEKSSTFFSKVGILYTGRGLGYMQMSSVQQTNREVKEQ